MVPLVLHLVDTVPVYPGPTYGIRLEPNINAMDDDKSIANIFCFGEFANKNSGIVYLNLTGLSRLCHSMAVSVSLSVPTMN
jgi:hypothetical protein